MKYLLLVSIWSLTAMAFSEEAVDRGIKGEKVCTEDFQLKAKALRETARRDFCDHKGNLCKTMTLDFKLPLEVGGLAVEKNMDKMSVNDAKEKSAKTQELVKKICSHKFTLGEAQNILFRWKPHGK